MRTQDGNPVADEIKKWIALGALVAQIPDMKTQDGHPDSHPDTEEVKKLITLAEPVAEIPGIRAQYGKPVPDENKNLMSLAEMCGKFTDKRAQEEQYRAYHEHYTGGPLSLHERTCLRWTDDYLPIWGPSRLRAAADSTPKTPHELLLEAAPRERWKVYRDFPEIRGGLSAVGCLKQWFNQWLGRGFFVV